MAYTPNERDDEMIPAERLVLVVDGDPVISRQMTLSLERSGDPSPGVPISEAAVMTSFLAHTAGCRES